MIIGWPCGHPIIICVILSKTKNLVKCLDGKELLGKTLVPPRSAACSQNSTRLNLLSNLGMTQGFTGDPNFAQKFVPLQVT